MTAEQIKEMRARVTHLKRFVRVEERMAKTESDQQLSLSPGFWDDNARATGILKEIKINKYWTDLYEKVEGAVEDFAVLFDFWKEGEAGEEEVKAAFEKATAEIDELEFKSTLNEPQDELSAVIQINSGAGGTESQDWAEMHQAGNHRGRRRIRLWLAESGERRASPRAYFAVRFQCKAAHLICICVYLPGDR